MNIPHVFYEQESNHWVGIIVTAHVVTVTSNQVSLRILFFVCSDFGNILTSNIYITN